MTATAGATRPDPLGISFISTAHRRFEQTTCGDAAVRKACRGALDQAAAAGYHRDHRVAVTVTVQVWCLPDGVQK